MRAENSKVIFLIHLFVSFIKHLNSSVKSQLSFVFLGTHSESSDTGHPSMGADELNQETAYAKINIEEHVGQAMVIQQFLEKFDATGKIVAYHSCKTSR